MWQFGADKSEIYKVDIGGDNVGVEDKKKIEKLYKKDRKISTFLCEET